MQRHRVRRPVRISLGRAIAGTKAIRLSEHGATLIEMAVVLPVFFLMVFGLLNFSIILFGRGNAICAAEAAARYAAVHSSTALVPATTASVVSYATGYIFAAPSGGTNITATYNPANNVGGTVTVTVTLTYSTGIPFYAATNITVSGFAEQTISR